MSEGRFETILHLGRYPDYERFMVPVGIENVGGDDRLEVGFGDDIASVCVGDRRNRRLINVVLDFATACGRAGLKNFRPHDLRHTCAAWLVQAGVSIREVAELLRHSDIRITMRYAHLAPEQVRAAVERLEPLTSHSGHTESKRGWLRVV